MYDVASKRCEFAMEEFTQAPYNLDYGSEIKMKVVAHNEVGFGEESAPHGESFRVSR